MFPVGDVNPTHRRPFVTWALILVNLGVYVGLQLPAEGCAALAFVYRYGAVPRELLTGAPLPPSEVDALLGACGPVALSSTDVALSVVTAMFVHGGIAHLLGNMLFLWVFGDNIEDIMGHVRYLLFYLLAGLAAGFAQVFTNPESTIPLIGASGAVSGLLAAYLVCFPHGRILTLVTLGFFITTFMLPAWMMIGYWIVLQVIQGTMSLGIDADTGGVAWFAHIGGFVAGLVLVFLFRDKNRVAYQREARARPERRDRRAAFGR